jgi:hypothetical protein
MARRLVITVAVGAALAAILAGTALAGAPCKRYLYKGCDQFTTICTPQYIGNHL